MNLNIYNTISKPKVFFKNSPQQRIIEQNFGCGYVALYQLITADHPVASSSPSLIVWSPLTQSPTQTLAQYFIVYVDYMDLQAYQQNDCTNLNDKHELDSFIEGCTHSLKLFNISRDDQKSMDPIMLQRFLQGSLINTLTAYLRELDLPDGPTHPSSCHDADSDNNTNDDQLSRGKFHSLRKTKGTASLHRSTTTRNIHKIKVNFQNPSVSIKIPDTMRDVGILCLQMYTASICAVIA